MTTPTLPVAATPGRVPLRRPRRVPRGFTLIELVVVAAISSVLFLIMLRWVLTLGTASSTTLDDAGTQRSASVAADAFAADVSAATPCAAGEYTALVALTPTRVSFTVPSAADRAVSNLVTWQVVDHGDHHSLERTVALHDPAQSDPCVFAAAADVRSYADVAAVPTDQVLAGAPDAAPAFAALVDGQVVLDPDAAFGDCAQHEDAARCHAAGLSVHWTLPAATTTSAPLTVTRTFLLPATTRTLS